MVTDAGSTKSDVVAGGARSAGRRGSGSSCRATRSPGRETNGPDAAIADLYVGQEGRPDAAAGKRGGRRRARRRRLARLRRRHPQADAGRSTTRCSPPSATCRTCWPTRWWTTSPTSRTPDQLFQYAASGFRDFTRIAGSSPEMWRDISLANREALLGELDAYLAQLTGLRAHAGRRRRRRRSKRSTPTPSTRAASGSKPSRPPRRRPPRHRRINPRNPA